MLSNSFETFVNSLQVTDDDQSKFDAHYDEIAKKLNEVYWELEDSLDHAKYVGSIGRKTAISGVSDLDMLFILPKAEKKRFDDYQGNGQSALLQEVKRKIKEIPSVKDAIVRGDGQVVVVDFSEEGYSIEVCPGFERTDGAFDYPDSNDGGKWKKTDPNPEIEESIAMSKETNEHFKYLAQLLRSWKNNEGFKFCGLLIDTLVYNFLEENTSHKSTSFNLYLTLMKDLYLYLKNQKEEQKYWYALGSNQHVYNKKGKFIKKAKAVYEKIKDLTENSDNVYEVFQEVFGLSFPMEESLAKSFVVETASYSRTEQYIESTYPVDIKFTLRIDCKVEQNGFLVDTLRNVLRKGFKLPRSRCLIFKIEENELRDWLDKSDLPRNYKVYWKVLNRGEEAMRRDMVRGQILKDDGKEQRKEHSDFNGEHLVECYIIYRGVCVARDRIHVPIMI